MQPNPSWHPPQHWSVIGVLLIISLCGCGGSRLFSGNPLASTSQGGLGQGGSGQAGLLSSRSPRQGRAGNSSRPTVQMSVDDAQPETSLPPVPQRLATINNTAARTTNPPSTSAVTPVGYDETVSQFAAKEPIPALATSELQAPAATPVPSAEKAESMELPSDLAGVDLTELMEALRDAPPAVQAQAIRRLVAMSHRQAQTSSQPVSIENALTGSLDSLPTLPDEVEDQGLSPRRLASSETTMRLSDAFPSPTDLPVAKPTAVKTVAARADSEKPIVSTVSMRTPSSQNADLPKLPPAKSDPQAIDRSPTPPQPIADTSPSMSPTELFAALTQQLSEAPSDESEADRTRRLITLRHLQVLAGDPDRAVDKVEELTTEQQEFLRHQLLGLWTIIDPNGHPLVARRFNSALPEIREATRFLSAATDTLEVRSLEFCTEIEAYGQFQPFAARKFEPGQEVILYCEIENFRCESVERGFETVLQGSYDVLDASGKSVASQTLPVDRQVSRQPLRDYFIAYQMHLPSTLAPASYQLRLTMEDVHGRKYGQSEVDFEITK